MQQGHYQGLNFVADIACRQLNGGLVVAAIIAAAVSIFVFAIGYVTEGRRARRRRLDEEAVNAAIAFVAAASKRRRQLGVLNSMPRRPSLVDKNMFQLDPPPEDVGNALKRYALILDDYGEAEAFRPESGDRNFGIREPFLHGG